MDTQTRINDLAEKLSFQVLPGPCRNSIANELSRNTTGTPINVKIKLRHKNDKDSADVFSVPKTGRPNNVNKLRLVSSDQTITSFNLLMQSDTVTGAKKSSKKQNKLLNLFIPGVCLGTRTDDNDYSYMPKEPANCDQTSEIQTHENIGKEMFGLKKNYVANEDLNVAIRQPKMFMGKCKPGGCLDPPFDEDKYTYESTKLRHVAEKEEHFQQNANVESPSINNNESGKSYLRTTSSQKNSLQKNCIKTDSLITYPSNLACDKPRSRNSKDKGSIDKPHNYITEDQRDKSNNNVPSYYTPAKRKDKSSLSRNGSIEDPILQNNKVVQYSNKKVSSISRDSILPPIGGPVISVLPDSVQLSIIESDVQTQNVNRCAKDEQEMSSFSDMISVTPEKRHSDLLVETIDKGTKEIRKLSYLESLSNNVIHALPNIVTQTIEPLHQITGNKDIIVIAPIKTSKEERHGYSDSEKNLNINILSASTMANSQEGSLIILPPTNKGLTNTEDKITTKNDPSLNTHDFRPSLSNANTNYIDRNENTLNAEKHDPSDHNYNAEPKSNSILTKLIYDKCVNEYSPSSSEMNNVVLPSNEQSLDIKEQIPTKHDTSMTQNVENANFNIALEPEINKNKSMENYNKYLRKSEHSPNNLNQLSHKTSSKNFDEARTKPLYIEETRDKGNQSLTATKQSLILKKQESDINKVSDDLRSKSILNETNQIFGHDDAPILSDLNHETLQSEVEYSPFSDSNEKLVSLKKTSDQNIKSTYNTIIKQDDEDIMLVPTSYEKSSTTELDEKYKIYTQDVESHTMTEFETKSELQFNVQSTYNITQPSDKNKNGKESYIVLKDDSLQVFSSSPLDTVGRNNQQLIIPERTEQRIRRQNHYQFQQTPDDFKQKFYLEDTHPSPIDIRDVQNDGISKSKDENEKILFYKKHKTDSIQNHNVSFTAEIKQKTTNSKGPDAFEISNRFKTVQDNKIYLDFSFNIHEDENKHTILKTYDSDNTPESVKKSQLLIKSTIGINDDEIRIPIDPVTDFVILVEKNDKIIKEKTEKNRSIASKGSSITETKYAKVAPVKLTQNIFEETISSIYEHNLVPVENMIRALNEDIKVLAQNQKVIKQMLKTNEIKTSKVLVGNRKCGCCRGLLM